jgi:hypothetical protein
MVKAKGNEAAVDHKSMKPSGGSSWENEPFIEREGV